MRVPRQGLPSRMARSAAGHLILSVAAVARHRMRPGSAGRDPHQATASTTAPTTVTTNSARIARDRMLRTRARKPDLTMSAFPGFRGYGCCRTITEARKISWRKIVRHGGSRVVSDGRAMRETG